MNIRTLAVTLAAPRDPVFNFLADIENLPRWAGGWCERLALERGRWWALTAEGEQLVDLETSAGPGVIDLRAGPRPDRMTPTVIRVFALSSRCTLVSITIIEAPDQLTEAYERRYQLLRAAAGGLLRRFGGGELHAPDPVPALVELGLNQTSRDSSGNHQAQTAAARASRLDASRAVRKSPTGASQPKITEAAAAASRPML